VKAIRWSHDDHYFGPFTYAYERSGKIAVVLGSGDDDDYPGCRFRISLGKHTLIVALPPLLKPQRKWVDTSHYEWSKGPGSGYWQTDGREFGFSTFDGSLHVLYGAQTNEWPGTKSKVFFYPWREHRSIRHSLYDLDGEHFADLPEWGFRHKNGWAVKEAIEAACPTAKFEFADFDGEKIIATTRIEEREWVRGKGLFRLLFIGRNTVRRSLDLRFSAEVGKRKGSWKGGTIGHSIDMLPGELHEAAFRRYCEQNALTFIGNAASGTSGSAQDAQRLDPKGAGPTAEGGDAPKVQP
jgi:hypothetical protein